MNYKIVQPPFTGKLRDMPAEKLRPYYQWFLGIMETRIEELTKVVNETSGFEAWKDDYTPKSLEVLGQWFAQQVASRPKAQEKIQFSTGQTAFPIEARNWELTDKTFSVAFDIGIYFGQTLKVNHPALHWEQDLKDKRFIDYGHLVLIGFGKVPLNPVRVLTTFAYGLIGKKKTGNGLIELYTIWEKMIAPR